MSQTGILSEVTTVRSRNRVADALPVLIEIPRIARIERTSRGRGVQAAFHADSSRNAIGRRRPRRRLRRHVRLSAWALLGLTPIVLASSYAWSGNPGPASIRSARAPEQKGSARVCLSDPARPDRVLDGRRTVPFDERPETLLSIEAAAAPSAADSDSVVVLPGYLLPDNSRQEPVHEGS
jgi:hypothetical protein